MSTDPEDLPQTWERPSHAALMAALATLELRPPVWNHRAAKADIVATQESLREQHKAAAARYLGTIIRSPLSWLADDDERDEVWSAASRRMAERCGRTAMGEVLRSWPFEPEAAPAPADASGSSSGVSTPSLEQDVGASIGAMPAPFEPFSLVIREPALTGDSLGLKTWASSYVLARSLPRIGATTLFRLFDESFGQPGPRVLELGSGTGLLGIAAAAVWRVHVTLTDLPGIVDNLKNNAERNAALVEERGGSLTVGRLTWGGRGEDEVDGALFGTPNQFKVSLSCSAFFVFLR